MEAGTKVVNTRCASAFRSPGKPLRLALAQRLPENGETYIDPDRRSRMKFPTTLLLSLLALLPCAAEPATKPSEELAFEKKLEGGARLLIFRKTILEKECPTTPIELKAGTVIHLPLAR